MSFIQVSGFFPLLEVVTTNPCLQGITLSHTSDPHVTEKQEHKAVKRLENVITSQIQIFTLHLTFFVAWDKLSTFFGPQFISGK